VYTDAVPPVWDLPYTTTRRHISVDLGGDVLEIGDLYCRLAVDVMKVGTFSTEDAASLADGEADPYGTDQLGITWRPKDHHVVLVDSGRVVAHAAFLPIEVEMADERLAGAGLGSVMVHRAFRGRGVGQRLIKETTTHMRALNRSYGLLFCRDARLGFYERLGWRRVLGEVTVDQESGPIVMPLFTCWRSFDGGTPSLTDDLRLIGLPF